MSNVMIDADRTRRRTTVLAIAVLAAACAAPMHSAAADFAAVEPEVDAAAPVPGMPPAPDLQQLRQQASPAAPGSPAATGQPPSNAPAAAATTQPASAPASITQPVDALSGTPSPGGISVVSWGIGPHLGSLAGEVTAGQPLYLWMTIAGGEGAVDRLSASGPIAIDVHWNRADDGATPGAPDLTTRLTIGQPGVLPLFAGEVARQGHFEWHSWARKDSLSPGVWTVSLTYPDGRPLPCGSATTAARACRFSVTIG